jgi:hypothetical protein
MNKYVLRTSLVWITILAVLAGIWVYRSHLAKQPRAMDMPMSGDAQPVASGPPPGANETASAMPEQKIETALVPVQLTPERCRASESKPVLSSTSN